jgi:hypothetical protein
MSHNERSWTVSAIWRLHACNSCGTSAFWPKVSLGSYVSWLLGSVRLEWSTCCTEYINISPLPFCLHCQQLFKLLPNVDLSCNGAISTIVNGIRDKTDLFVRTILGAAPLMPIFFCIGVSKYGRNVYVIKMMSICWYAVMLPYSLFKWTHASM